MTETTEQRRSVTIRLLEGHNVHSEVSRHARFLATFGPVAMYADPRWLTVVQRGLRAKPYLLEASSDGQITGLLPLAYVHSRLFGRYLVSIHFFSWAGVAAMDPNTAGVLIDRAIQLADDLDVRHLQLRHITPIDHPKLSTNYCRKTLARLSLEGGEERTWSRLRSTTRTQVRKGSRQNFEISWGKADLVDVFYDVFAANMRDLGTPVFSRRLFQTMLEQFPETVEVCLVRRNGAPVGGGLLVHGPTVSEVPWVSVLRKYRRTAVNSYMYWEMIRRTIERGQQHFEFGRSTIDSPTHDFKKKWGTESIPLNWQFYLRKGSVDALRPESGKHDRSIRLWQRLPVWLTRIIGPPIARGIP